MYQECKTSTSDDVSELAMLDATQVKNMLENISTQLAHRGLPELSDDIVQWK
jgi:hypothetical protein